MGVVFTAADDVADLLCPFIVSQGGIRDTATIEDLYLQASLGKLSSPDFWTAVGLDTRLEDEYLGQVCLMPGLVEFLQSAAAVCDSLWCVSNDVPTWSQKLRRRFDLTDFFQGFVISGDIGIRKPDRGIFEVFLRRVGVPPHNVFFVDDRVRNLDTARSLGIQTVHLAQPDATTLGEHVRVEALADVLQVVMANTKSHPTNPYTGDNPGCSLT